MSLRVQAKELNEFICSKVIVRDGDESKELQVGMLVGFQEHHSGSAMPLFLPDGKKTDEDILLCFSPMLPYSEALWAMLRKMTPQEQMDFFVDTKSFICALRHRCRGKRA